MAKVVVTSLVVIMLLCITGCPPADSGRSTLMTTEIKAAPVVRTAGASESDLVEQLTTSRQAYFNALNSLIAYYQEKGNSMKLRWAKDELSKLEGMRHYNYIPEGMVLPENLRPTASISEADLMYREALRIEQDAGMVPILKDEKRLRSALELYNQLIKKFPTSDKIADAAWHAAGIYEYFRDYSIALPYYQRVYQWDPKTNYPARYKAAEILDKYLERRDEALELYRQSLQLDALTAMQRRSIEARVRNLTRVE